MSLWIWWFHFCFSIGRIVNVIVTWKEKELLSKLLCTRRCMCVHVRRSECARMYELERRKIRLNHFLSKLCSAGDIQSSPVRTSPASLSLTKHIPNPAFSASWQPSLDLVNLLHTHTPTLTHKQWLLLEHQLTAVKMSHFSWLDFQ